MLAGAARLLSARRDEIPGRVLFMFQPGEEGHHGARFMLDEGLLDVPPLADGTPSPVTGAFALHITSTLPTGWVSSRGGPIMASADRFLIDVDGRGGHASEPFRALDPIPIACEIVQAMQMMVTRSIDVFDPAVVTVGRITAGTTNNIIPETAEIEGTIRTVSESTRAKVHDNLRRVAEGIAAAHGADVDGRDHRRLSGHVELRSFADFTIDVADGDARRRQGRADAQPDHGRRGLQLRAAEGAGLDDVPRRHAARPRSARRPPPTTRTGSCSTRRR